MLRAGWEVLLKFRRESRSNCSAGANPIVKGSWRVDVRIEGSWKGGIIGSSLGLGEERRCTGQVGGLKWGATARLGMCP